MSPLIDIVCVAYRRPGPLRVLVQCLLNQTAPNWRLRVYHDGPDAEVERVLQDASDGAPERVSYRMTEVRYNDYGHSLREIGLRECGGDYVLLTNDDNYYVPRFIEFATQAIVEADPDVVMFDMVHSHDNPGYRPVPGYSYFRTEYSRYNIDMGAALVRTPLAKAAGFRDKTFAGDATYFEDVARTKPTGLKVCKVPRVLFVHN